MVPPSPDATKPAPSSWLGDLVERRSVVHRDEDTPDLGALAAERDARQDFSVDQGDLGREVGGDGGAIDAGLGVSRAGAGAARRVAGRNARGAPGERRRGEEKGSEERCGGKTDAEVAHTDTTSRAAYPVDDVTV